ncbi:MAG TPA: iron export ABC transporter permease subunit FetB [Aggregatilinea sp.]|uniref:ABC transporter permease n=1 Tax=Aggregatilinea sp. TaxID=2806333 RepID=UPI002C850089|nr:iron export ABC transporter permease subunit FetB [Aggregatilinea sp.]HML21499.1 iron export ABC transporter permease subunit FetB [Aggregatilinea sp.]
MNLLNDALNGLGDAFANLNDLPRIGLALALVAVAALISYWQRAGVEKDLASATARSFVQLVAIGYVLELIFNQENPLWTVLMLLVMIVVGARTSGRRGKATPHATRVSFLSITLGSALTLAVLVIGGVFSFTPQAIIPIGGMIIGNAMTTAAQVMNRMSDDLLDQRPQIESMLALGATSRQAAQIQFRRALRSAMIPHIDTTKTVGLIKLPGAMTGMILAGASPLEAVQLQIIVMYMLVGAVTFTGLISAYLTYREFFTPAYQLKSLTSPVET